MRDYYTTWECSHHCPHHFPILVPNLPPCFGWGSVGSKLIYCVSNLLNEVPKAKIKFWKTPVPLGNNSIKVDAPFPIVIPFLQRRLLYFQNIECCISEQVDSDMRLSDWP